MDDRKRMELLEHRVELLEREVAELKEALSLVLPVARGRQHRNTRFCFRCGCIAGSNRECRVCAFPGDAEGG